jgi:hypothetical protein
MKKLTVKLLLIFAIFSVYSCKNQELTPVNNVNITPGSTTGNSTGSGVPFDPSTQTLVSQGTFKDGGHPTSGTAKLYKKGTTHTLVFETFKSDEGPDLRIYLSADTGAKNFIELTELKNTGNFYLTLPDNSKVDQRMFVLIWCKRFSVLFGSAELKAVTQM